MKHIMIAAFVCAAVTFDGGALLAACLAMGILMATSDEG